ncbi:transposase, IS4 family [Bathymodiolus platifrons methanotrophic gill symbiont]|uniref:transposase n=7 Tax=unclassified Gammaproteobacteria TaxID=33811 RepID=UPI001B7843EE|nr:transposase, IS4 family [Bathymodiolus platifrons methanotrophic gill symbiont]GFO75490.1 transposase, IS4 family [Bathymodiolus platifrons methanotrophic gill symbiont]GFO76402.1 transposase, IS4 family [Bathymodiolus platifrons methanotrophic gill symbiont]
MLKDLPLFEHIHQHCNESMERALLAERHPLWARSCPELKDIDFIRLGLLRCISVVDSGRHFLQTNEQIYGQLLPHSTYFKSLKSHRRTSMLEAFEQQSYHLHAETLLSQGIDYLKAFPELDEYTIEAADGHFIDHACHTEKNSKGKVYAAGGIYALNLRSGLLRFLCLVTNGTQRHQEIPVLRDHIEKQNKGNNSSQKHLYVYDKAVTDFAWWDRQKRHANYMISMLKENSIATLVESIPFDARHEINTGVEAYSVYENKGIKFNVVDYRDPETGKLHRFVTTLPMTINPGTIAMLYFKRWTIEKTFNNTKSNFKETKAWSSNPRSLENQMRLTAMSYNLMRVFEEISKTQQPELIHPSDKKYSEALEIRQQQAQKRDRFVNPLFFQARISRISSYTIRAVQNAIITGMSLQCFMSSLVARLVSRPQLIGEH